jgi:DNA-binding NarL/FixJ family response regulator
MAIPPRIKEPERRDLMRLVVVDDHAFMRDLMARTLGQQSGRYVVLAAVGTAAEAIAVCGELKPDLVILDI